MDTPKIFESEYRFCLILWEREPVSTTELVRLCQDKLGWKRTTTYTVIKRLGERWRKLKSRGMGIRFIAHHPKEEQVSELDELMEKKFQGSLPAFLAAFARRQELSQEEVEEIRRIIEK